MGDEGKENVIVLQFSWSDNVMLFKVQLLLKLQLLKVSIEVGVGTGQSIFKEAADQQRCWSRDTNRVTVVADSGEGFLSILVAAFTRRANHTLTSTATYH